MPHLVELSTKTSNKTKSKIKPTQNFLMQTLKELSPKKAVDFLKNLHLDKKEIKDIILKLPKNEQNKYLNILDKEFLIQKNSIKLNSKKTNEDSNPKKTDKKEELKTDIKNLLKIINENPQKNNSLNKNLQKPPASSKHQIKADDIKTDKKEPAKKNIDNLDKKEIKTSNNTNETDEIINLILNQANNENPKIQKSVTKIQKNVLEIIKKEIDSNTTLQKLIQSKKAIKEIKNASSFKELVQIANKNGLNIKKIVAEIIKPHPSDIKPELTTKSDLPDFNSKPILLNKKIIQHHLQQKTEPKKAQTDLPDFRDIINHKNAPLQKESNKKTEPKNSEKFNSITQLLNNKKTNENHKNSDKSKTKSDLPDFNSALNISKLNTHDKKAPTILNDLLTTKQEKKDVKKNIEEIKPDAYQININNPQTEIKTKAVSAKETLRHFSTNLKDAIENYKPPVSKISLELNPKELGKVDVTIIKRGDNLQIQINSNNNAINIFHMHQNELKNSLINMGFNGVDMQFNSNQNKERQQKAYKQYTTNKEEEYDELVIEMPYKYA